MTKDLTFAGIPGCKNIDALSADIAVIGAPLGTGYHPGEKGVSARAPAAIRKAMAKFGPMRHNYDFDLAGSFLDKTGIRVVDCGDIPGDPLDPAGNRIRITETTHRILEAGAVPVLLGGDDSVPIPFFRAYSRHQALTVVQIDAHIDWRDRVGDVFEGPSSTMRRASEMPWIERLLQIGMRGVGSAGREELQDAKYFGARVVTAKSLREKGTACVLEKLNPASSCLITIDCDALDPSVMPAVRAPLPDGLMYHQVIELIDGLTEKVSVLGFDIVELVPSKDINGISALTAGRIVWHFIGRLARSMKKRKSEIGS